MRSRSRLAAVVATVALGACTDEGGAGGSGGPGGSVAPSAVPTTACADCRTVAAGSAFQDGDTAVGVSRCDGTSCEVVVAAPDGSETELDVAAGDALDVGAGWIVVATGAPGLTLRPA